jgi:PQQ-dependent catabolism-associated beta-propeller protein
MQAAVTTRRRPRDEGEGRAVIPSAAKRRAGIQSSAAVLDPGSALRAVRDDNWRRTPAIRGFRRAELAAFLLGSLLVAANPALAFTAYVTNEKGNSVTIIDTDKLEAIKTFAVGKRPRGIAIGKDGARLYVCAGDDDVIQVFDTKTLKRTATIESGDDPEQLAISPDGATIYIANENDNLVTIVDAQSGKKIDEIPVGVEPEGVAVSPDGKTIVSTSETTNMAHFIDPATKKIVANVLVAARPRYAAFRPDGSEVWVSSEVGGAVSVIDPVRHAVTQTITFDVPGLGKEAIQPVGIRITADSKTAFVALGPANRVAVVDAQTKKVEKYLLVGQRVWQLAFTPDEKYLLTTNGVSNDVSVIDVAARKVVKSIAVGQQPWGVAVAPQ